MGEVDAGSDVAQEKTGSTGDCINAYQLEVTSNGGFVLNAESELRDRSNLQRLNF